MQRGIIEWTATTGARGGVSVFHADDDTPFGLIRQWLAAFVDKWATLATSQWSATAVGEIAHLDTATGQLLSVNAGSPHQAIGAVATESVADSTCALLRYQTSGIVDGHRVRGRTYVPGLPSAEVVDGQWQPTFVASLESLASAYADNAGAAVYARPKYDRASTPPVLVRPGSSHAMGGSNAWPQCAVLRHRRQA